MQENQLLRIYIEQRADAYILDEAERLGIAGIHVRTEVKWGDESWVPYEVYLDCGKNVDPEGLLRSFLDTELGIPPERQHWDA